MFGKKTTTKEIKTINNIYVDSLGEIDINTSINSVIGKDITFTDSSLNGLTVDIVYMVIEVTQV